MAEPAEKIAEKRSLKARAILVVALAFFMPVLAAGGWFLGYVFSSGPVTGEKTVAVFIPKGESTRGIGELLSEKKLVYGGIRFVLLTRIMGDRARLQAGEFLLHTGQTPVELIRELSQAKPVQHSVTIPEGLNILETSEIFADGGWVDSGRFVDLTGNKQFIAELGFSGSDSLEGYLYPDTYYLTLPSPGEEKLVRQLTGKSLAVWEALSAGIKSELSMHQVFTLASIVEKETGKSDERPIIAAVFLNRLKKGMRLQSDPTVIYGLENFSGKISRADLKRSTPYNTYVIAGLPPGPICSPGKESIRAVLFPAEVDYLYFVSKNDGSHYFSKTLREHNRAVRKYQR